MNIAIVVYSHFSRDARVRRYAESLARHGYHVDVICLLESYTSPYKNIHLSYFPFPRKRYGKVWYFIEYSLFFLFCFLVISIKHLVRRYKVIHVNNMPDILVFSALVPKLFGSKVILDIHDPMPELYQTKYDVSSHSVELKIIKLLEKISLNFSDIVLTANENFKSLLLLRYPHLSVRIFVILNCPDKRIFKTVNKRQLTINNHGFTLMYMGTIEKRFGLDIVLNSLKSLSKKIPHLKFQIIAKLKDEGEYFQKFKKNIMMLGIVRNISIEYALPLELIVNRLRTADVGIVLAKNGVFTEYIFPVKLLEFIQMNIPVIATKTKTLSESFFDNQIYFLNKNNSLEFSKAVLRLYKNKKLRKSYAQRAKIYLKNHNWKIERKKYISLVRNLFNA